MSYKYQSKTCQLIDLVHHAETSASKTVKHYSIRLNDEQPARVIKQLITKFGKDNGRVIVFC